MKITIKEVSKTHHIAMGGMAHIVINDTELKDFVDDLDELSGNGGEMTATKWNDWVRRLGYLGTE